MARRKPAPVPASPVVESTAADGTTICSACAGSHELRGCSTTRAVEILVEQGRPMSAHEVKRRIASKDAP